MCPDLWRPRSRDLVTKDSWAPDCSLPNKYSNTLKCNTGPCSLQTSPFFRGPKSLPASKGCVSRTHQEIKKRTRSRHVETLSSISTSQGARSVRLLVAGKLQVVLLGGDSHLPLASHDRQRPVVMPTWADLWKKRAHGAWWNYHDCDGDFMKHRSGPVSIRQLSQNISSCKGNLLSSRCSPVVDAWSATGRVTFFSQTSCRRCVGLAGSEWGNMSFDDFSKERWLMALMFQIYPTIVDACWLYASSSTHRSELHIAMWDG